MHALSISPQKTEIKMKKLYVFLASAAIVMGGMFLQSCENETDSGFDNTQQEGRSSTVNLEIVRSVEMEDFIFAGADLFQAKAAFTEALNSIDFSQLEVTNDENGKKIIHLPSDFTSIGIESNLQAFNEKRSVLQRRFPQLASFGEEASKEHFTRAIRRLTIPVHSAPQLIRSAPRLRSDVEADQTERDWSNDIIETFDGFMHMFGQVYHWMNCCVPRELAIFAFADGTFATHLHADATYYTTRILMERNQRTNELFFRQGNQYSPIVWVAHTHHRGSCSSPSDADIRFRNLFPQVEHKIFFNGRFHPF